MHCCDFYLSEGPSRDSLLIGLASLQLCGPCCCGQQPGYLTNATQSAASFSYNNRNLLAYGSTLLLLLLLSFAP